MEQDEAYRSAGLGVNHVDVVEDTGYSLLSRYFDAAGVASVQSETSQRSSSLWPIPTAVPSASRPTV
jgi:hypothetical protein